MWLTKLRREPDTQDFIKFLTDMFRQVGYLSHLLSDNSTQFMSEFSTFCRRAGINWTPSSPYNLQSNGKVECQIRILKDLLDKTLRSGEEFEKALFVYRIHQGLLKE